jgi:aspartyl-tRNA synthetase
MYRTHTCGELRKEDNGKEVELAGWVSTRRDHGGVIFIDLRDRYGITQVAFDPKRSKKAMKLADKLRSEFVIQVKGTVNNRPKDMINKKLDTGEIEVDGGELVILNESKTPPFEIGDQSQEVNEDLRLRYRYLDLRNPKMLENLEFRNKIVSYIRKYMEENGFINVDTPILTASSPEGARDYLVPSRLHPGKFYALPQAPQMFKQLLMVAGVDKYYQIAPCFRDEDARADRSPGEFYQLDLEMSFVEQEDVFKTMEPLFVGLAEKVADKKIVETPFPRIPYEEAMNRFGTDKPDLRFELELFDITDIAKKSEFKVFKDAELVKGIVYPKGSKLSRGDIDILTEFVKELGAKGLAYMKVTDKGLDSNIVKFFSDGQQKDILKESGAKKGDMLFFIADKESATYGVMGELRLEIAQRLDLRDPNKVAYCWIVDFSMYEKDEKTGKIDFGHNPFSMPQGGMKSLEEKEPLEVMAHQYDIVANGIELSSGAVRNYNPDILVKAFQIVGYDEKEIKERFAGLYEAFQYGAPPHAGFAPGIERIVMVLKNTKNIREVVAFPKNQKAEDPMMRAPGKVRSEQLKELHLKIVKDD